MNGDLKIFIAGAKKLEEERKALKALVNNINFKYQKKGIRIIAGSFEQFDDNQLVYNDYIEKSADIVIIIIDDVLGAKTQEEFVKATESYKATKHPEVMVFMHKYSERTPEIARIEQLLQDKFDNKYYVEYLTIADLTNKAEKRIERYIDKHIDEIKSSNETEITPVKKSWIKTMCVAAVIVIVALAGVMSWMYYSYKRPLMVLAGGGSVKEYLKSYHDIDIETYPHSINIALASGSSWRVLFEEAHQYTEEKTKNGFITVCMSACKMDSSAIKEYKSNSDENTKIVEVFLGYDVLSVYISEDMKKDEFVKRIIEKSDTITTSELANLLYKRINKESDFRIYTTNKLSGTLETYKKHVSNNRRPILFDKMIDDKEILIYYNSATINNLLYGYERQDINNHKPFIVLGSKYYTFKDDRDDGLNLFVVDSTNKIIKKPMYLYVLAKTENRDDFEVNETILEFLDEVNNNLDNNICDHSLLDSLLKRKKISNSTDPYFITVCKEK